MLPTRAIGTTDIEVTTLGFGGGTLGGIGDRIGDDQAIQVLKTAWDAGIRYFDTAPLYGQGLSERRLGAWLSAQDRKDFTLSSKVGRLVVPDPDGRGQAIAYDYSYDGARKSLERSLERLGLDRVDILLCHDIDVWTHEADQPGIFATAAAGILPALSDLRSEGVIRAFGLGVNESDVCMRVMENFDVDCFLLAGRFTLLEQAPLENFLPKCLKKQVSIIIGGPYNSGMLARSDRRRATYDYKPVDDTRWHKALKIREICDAHDVDIRAAALQYPLRHPAVAAVIPGVWQVEEVLTNLECFSAEIPSALWEELAAENLALRL